MVTTSQEESATPALKLAVKFATPRPPPTVLPAIQVTISQAPPAQLATKTASAAIQPAALTVSQDSFSHQGHVSFAQVLRMAAANVQTLQFARNANHCFTYLEMIV